MYGGLRAGFMDVFIGIGKNFVQTKFLEVLILLTKADRMPQIAKNPESIHRLRWWAGG